MLYLIQMARVYKCLCDHVRRGHSRQIDECLEGRSIIMTPQVLMKSYCLDNAMTTNIAWAPLLYDDHLDGYTVNSYRKKGRQIPRRFSKTFLLGKGLKIHICLDQHRTERGGRLKIRTEDSVCVCLYGLVRVKSAGFSGLYHTHKWTQCEM